MAGPEATAPTARDGLGQIIVTARRVEESLQRAPVSIVALDAAELKARSVTNLRALQNFVPNLTLAPSQNVGEAAGNAFIRGIGQEDFAAGAEPGVGFYLDGVYFARTLGTLMTVVDLERIEVLRGPQGTLFGKNTIGGAINLISQRPRPGSEGYVETTIGTDERFEARGVFNQPISPRLLLRASVGLASREGYLDRLPPPVSRAELSAVSSRPIDLRREGAERSRAARLQLRWLASERLTLDAMFDLSSKRNSQGAIHIDAIDPRYGVLPDLNALIRQGRLPGPEITADLVLDDLLASRATGGNTASEDLWGAALTAVRDLGSVSLKFIGAYRGLRSHHGTDSDGLYFRLTETTVRLTQSQLSGELQLSGKSGRLSFVGGLFAFGERIKLRPPAAVFNEILYTCRCYYTPGGEPRFNVEYRDLGDETFAAYAQGSFAITDDLSVTLGARYSLESKWLRGEAFALDASLQPTSTVIARGANDGNWDRLTYRAGLEYQLRETVMLYGSLAKGFKSGGFNARGAVSLPNLGYTAFKPENALTYELGLRSEWLDHRLRLNGTLFRTEYRDVQLRQQTLVSGVQTTQIENAARARISGAEVELTARPIEQMTLGAAYGHIDARYLDVGRVPGLTLASRFQRTPRHSLAIFAETELPVRFGTLTVHFDYTYRSKEQFQILAAVNDQPAYALLGARVSLRLRGDAWHFALFGTNLADARYRTAGRGTLLEQSGLAYSSVGMPRQVGLVATRRF